MSATISPGPALAQPLKQEAQAESLRAAESVAKEDALRKGIIETEISTVTARWMTWSFVAFIVGLPLLQAGYELSRGERPQAVDVFTRTPTQAHLHEYEEDLARNSLFRQFVQPRLQAQISALGGFGNHKVVLGSDGWLFYEPGIEYLMGPPILSEIRIGKRAKKVVDEHSIRSFPDPRPAILEFQRFCEENGIALVVLPVPDKAMLEARHLTERYGHTDAGARLDNPDYEKLITDLRAEGVDVFEPSREHPAGEDLFLRQDTHWTPQWMNRVSADLAAHLRNAVPLAPASGTLYRTKDQNVTRVGDLVDMLRLSADQRIFPPQTVRIASVLDAQTDQPVRPDEHAEVLILGDSFCNIYSVQAMGWGESAGFVEHLSRHLGLSLDRITQNDAGAHATRETLGRELARNPNRLAGKKAIVWEFAMRELTDGEWQPVAMKTGLAPKKANRPLANDAFYVVKSGESCVVTGTILARSRVPLPGSVPYKDHIMVLHFGNLTMGNRSISGQAIVYAWSMRDNKQTRAARLKTGDSVTITLRLWTDVSEKLGSINRSELDDLDLQLETPNWGEVQE